MLRIWILAVLTVVIFIGPPHLFSQDDPDPGIPDTVRIGCPIEVPTIVPGDSIRIPVYIWADYSIAGFGIGITHNYDYVVIESFDTAGTALTTEQAQYLLDAYSPVERHAYVGWVPFDTSLYIHPSGADTGTFIFALNLKVLPGAAPAMIDLDTAYAEPCRYFIMSADISSGGGVEIVSFIPQYTHCPGGDIYLGMTLCGDVDGNGAVNLSDAVYLLSYIFGQAPGPEPSARWDVDCSGTVRITDAVYLIAYIFSGGREPCDPSGDGVPDC